MLNTSDLRKDILGDLADLRSGKITRAEARARAMLMRNALDTMKIEIAATALRADSFQPVSLEPRMITVSSNVREAA